jgi:hypothetical protein
MDRNMLLNTSYKSIVLELFHRRALELFYFSTASTRTKCILELPQFTNMSKSTIWYQKSTVVLASTRLRTRGIKLYNYVELLFTWLAECYFLPADLTPSSMTGWVLANSVPSRKLSPQISLLRLSTPHTNLLNRDASSLTGQHNYKAATEKRLLFSFCDIGNLILKHVLWITHHTMQQIIFTHM